MFAQDGKKIDELFKCSSEDFLCVDKGEADGCLGVEITSEKNIMTSK